MGCGVCAHGYGMDWSGSLKGEQTIECTLNPVWVSVSSEHFCGHYWNDHAAPKYNGERAARREEDWAARERYRQRAVDAERKLKAANKRLREMRSKGGAA